MKKIELVEDPELTKIAREKRNRPIEVQIVMKDGKTFTQRVDYPLGSPENPMSDSDLTDKFRDLVSPVLGDMKLEELLNSVTKLEEVQDVGELMSLLH